MRLLKFANVKSAVGAALLLCPVLAWGSFSPSGPESAKAGQLRGDQTLPQVAISPEGGLLVWQDNNVDGSGLGIKAQRLDAGLNKLGAAFRVNLQPANDQERPQVALLRQGGAVFVWQGGRPGAQRIYARFLAANGTFVSSDLRVNTYTNGTQVEPAVTALADGSALVVWSSQGQDGSLQGIYGQRLSPKGAKLGGEFRVNQFTANNQRTPVVVGLTNGNYVVAWVSELQRGAVSVDVYARMFERTGVPVGEEFPVNVSAEKTCANPSISASLLNGGFALAWSRDDNQRLALGNSGEGVAVTNVVPRSMQGWDVLARVYGPAGNALTGEITVNQTTYGDQFAPVIRAFGEDYGVVWTSLAQDGSREGVFGQFLTAAGGLTEAEFRVNSTTVSRQLQPSLASDNHSQLVAVWSSFTGGGMGFDVMAQNFASAEIIPLERLTNSLPAIEEPNNGLPRLEFPDAGSFNEPAANAFALAAGNYHGLCFERSGVNAGSSGSLAVKTTAKGTYSGKLQLGGASYSLKGAFDESGWAASVINRKNATPLTVYLQMDLGGGDSLRGGVSDGDWWADLQADRQVFDKVSRPTPLAGKYTLLIRGGDNGPAGDGIGTLTVDAAGALSLTGTLADGTKVAQKSVISKDGYWPLYVNLYKGAGVLIGWLEFANEAGSDLDGSVIWSKRADSLAASYPAGFVNSLSTVGSRFTAPATGQKILDLTDGKLTFTGNPLASPLDRSFALGVNNVVTGETGLKLTIAAKAGTFKGTATLATVVVPFQGVLLQKANQGGGYFLNGNQSGKVKLEPVP